MDVLAYDQCEMRGVSDLLRQIAETNEQVSRVVQYARCLESDFAERNTQYEILAAEAEAIRKAAISDKVILTEYANSLREQLADLPRLRDVEQQLIDQSRKLIEVTQAEAAEISYLIDIVQTSHFWTAKRWLQRLRARLLPRRV